MFNILLYQSANFGLEIVLNHLKSDRMKSLTIVVLFLFLSLNQSYAVLPSDDIIKEVANAIESMDAKKLSGYFNSTIDLEIGDTDGNYSKTQAEMIVRDFFKNSPLTSFTVNHEGSSNDGSKYFIGTYKTSSQEYRVYVLLKNQKDQLLIHQFQFEKE